jgi:transcriptional regulator with XRE-family HTH domain
VDIIALTLADRIRIARRRANRSRQEVAAIIGVSPSAIRQWEHSRGTTPKPVNLLLLASFLGVSVDWLVCGSNTDKRPSRPEQHLPEWPAVDLTTFAGDVAEELLLRSWRQANASTRAAVLSMLGAEPEGAVSGSDCRRAAHNVNRAVRHIAIASINADPAGAVASGKS